MNESIRDKVEEFLEREYYCPREKLNSNDIVYTINTMAKKPHIKIMAYKNCVIVCTSEDLFVGMQELLRNKTRDEIFELPLVYGQTIHYVPDISIDGKCSTDSDYEFEFLFEEDVLSLRGLKGFENSLEFDEHGHTPTKAIYIAKDNNKIIGVSGAVSSSVNGLWEIGIDVVPEYRKSGIGTCLVKKLTEKLFEKNIDPFYSASVTNIGSQMVAGRCGYISVWIDTFGTILDGSSVYSDILNDLVARFSKE